VLLDDGKTLASHDTGHPNSLHWSQYFVLCSFTPHVISIVWCPWRTGTNISFCH